mgnify:CR=1 FL=1
MTASAGAWYRVGTVNVTNGSAAIVGVGSNWQNDVIAIAIGDAFTIDAKTWYEVIAVNSDTSITLDRGFEGATANDVEYAILRNTSGTILTRIAGQIAVQFNQKQLFLDELRNWLTSEDETATLTDSHGVSRETRTITEIDRASNLAESRANDAAENIQTAIDSALNIASDIKPSETPMLSIPFNDGIRIEHGYGVHDKLDISAAQDGSLVVDLPTKSAGYTALGVRWNFNKAGIFEELSPGEPAITEKGLYLNAEYTNYQTNNTQMHLLSTIGLTTSEAEIYTPIGNTCTEIVEDDELNEHFVKLVTLSAVEGDYYNISAFVKAGSGPGSRGVMLRSVGTNETARFNVSDEGVLTIKSGSMVDLERYSDGWYRISFSIKAAATGNIDFRFQLTIDSDSSYMGDGTSSVFIVGAQITKTRYLRPLVFTAGSAVTTPESRISIPIAGNVPTDGGAFTFAIDVDMHMDRGDEKYGSFFTLGNPTTYLGLEGNSAGTARLRHSLGAWEAFDFNENTETGMNRLVIVYTPTSEGGNIKTFHNGEKIIDRDYEGDGLAFTTNGFVYLSATRSGLINRDGYLKNLKVLNYAASESEIASWGAPK